MRKTLLSLMALTALVGAGLLSEVKAAPAPVGATVQTVQYWRYHHWHHWHHWHHRYYRW
jgi:hypothetical protein